MAARKCANGGWLKDLITVLFWLFTRDVKRLSKTRMCEKYGIWKLVEYGSLKRLSRKRQAVLTGHRKELMI